MKKRSRATTILKRQGANGQPPDYRQRDGSVVHRLTVDPARHLAGPGRFPVTAQRFSDRGLPECAGQISRLAVKGVEDVKTVLALCPAPCRARGPPPPRRGGPARRESRLEHVLGVGKHLERRDQVGGRLLGEVDSVPP